MGIYVNPGNASFQEAINSEIYVDKSGLIAYINGVIRTCWQPITAAAAIPVGCSPGLLSKGKNPFRCT